MRFDDTPAYAQKAVLRQYFHIEPSQALIEKWIYLTTNPKIVTALIVKWGTKEQIANRYGYINKKANEHKTRKKEQEAARNTPEYKVDLATKRMIALQKELDIQKAKLADPKFEVMKPIIQRDITFYENQLAIAEKQLAKLVLR